jgi:hypothetical protein
VRVGCDDNKIISPTVLLENNICITYPLYSGAGPQYYEDPSVRRDGGLETRSASNQARPSHVL